MKVGNWGRKEISGRKDLAAKKGYSGGVKGRNFVKIKGVGSYEKKKKGSLSSGPWRVGRETWEPGKIVRTLGKKIQGHSERLWKGQGWWGGGGGVEASGQSGRRLCEGSLKKNAHLNAGYYRTKVGSLASHP